VGGEGYLSKKGRISGVVEWSGKVVLSKSIVNLFTLMQYQGKGEAVSS
jgi:hypothetical protein